MSDDRALVHPAGDLGPNGVDRRAVRGVLGRDAVNPNEERVVLVIRRPDQPRFEVDDSPGVHRRDSYRAGARSRVGSSLEVKRHEAARPQATARLEVSREVAKRL